MAQRGPISGNERVAVLQGDNLAWATKAQVTAILAAQDRNPGRPPMNRWTSAKGDETFLAIQGGQRVYFTAADLTTWLAAPGNGSEAAGGAALTTITGAELLPVTLGSGDYGYLDIGDVLGLTGGVEPAPVKSWQIIGQYNDTGFAAQGSNASSVQVVTRKRDIPNIDLEAVRSLEQTFFVGTSSGGVDTTITNVVNIEHKLSNASTQLAISPSPVAVPAFEGAYPVLEYTGAIPAGSTLYLDKKATVPTSGQNTGTQTLIYSNQGAASAVGYKAGSTVTFDTTGLSTGTGSLLCPITIGYGVHLYPTFGAIGDSIISRNGETYDGDGGPVGVEGRTVQGGAWMRRANYLAQVAAGRTVPLRLLSRPSAQMTGMRSSSGAGGAKRRASYPYFNHLIIQMGTNDLGNSRTAAQLKADIEAEIVDYRAAWAAAQAAAGTNLPCYVIVCTLLPRVASHGSTTRLAYADQIEEHNYNARHGLIVGSNGYWDPNLAVRSVADETLWLDLNDEFDGLHPLPPGYAKIAAEVAPFMAMDSSPWRSFL